jgi:DNA-binding MarR family transcriptional regulator
VTPSSPLPIDPIAEAKRQWLLHGWADAANGMATVTSIVRAQQLLLGRVEAALKPFNLSFARLEMLTLLSFTRDGSLPMASASARLQVHPTSVTNTVDRLERDGLARREPHPTDGRATLVVLTDAGRDLVARATARLNDDVFAQPGIPDDDMATLVRILARFRRDSGDFVDPVPAPDPL